MKTRPLVHGRRSTLDDQHARVFFGGGFKVCVFVVFGVFGVFVVFVLSCVCLCDL